MPENLPSDPQDTPVTLFRLSSSSDNSPASQQADASTHLANERTFLAWSLMGIIIIGSGVALARMLIALNTSPLGSGEGIVSNLFKPKTMGLLFIAAGLIVLVMATYRFLSVQEQIAQQRYRPSGTLVMMLLVLVLALSILLIGFLLQQRA
jgi:putative membrane protein